jgi:hypothetical protein
LLENKCLLEVKGAEDKKTARPGVVYLALSDHHLLVESNGDLILSSEEAVNYSRPSIAAAGGIALVEEPSPPPTPREGGQAGRNACDATLALPLTRSREGRSRDRSSAPEDRSQSRPLSEQQSRRQKRNAFNRRRWSRLGRRSKGFGTRT